jgi:hypothetical protein
MNKTWFVPKLHIYKFYSPNLELTNMHYEKEFSCNLPAPPQKISIAKTTTRKLYLAG